LKKWIFLLVALLPALSLHEVRFVGPLEPIPYVTTPSQEELLSIRISAKWNLDYSIASRYVSLAIKHENKKGFPSRYDILAVAQVESNFKANALDPLSPSVGLMQINAPAHKVTKESMMNPDANIRKGSEVLKTYRQLVKTDAQALVMYNAGPRGFASLCAGNPSCTTTYSAKVLQAKAELLGKMQPKWKFSQRSQRSSQKAPSSA